MESWFWVLSWFLSIVTIIGNGIIIFLVCRKRKLHTKTNMFVVSLAVADLCVGISVVPLLFSYEITRDRSYSRGLHKGMLIVRWLFQDLSVMNLCSLVLERYIAMVMPLKYLHFMTRHRALTMIFLPWTITVVFILLEATLWIALDSSLNLKVFNWLVIIFFEFFPCCIVIFCLISMIRIVCKHNRVNSILTRQLRFNHRVSNKPYEKSAIVMMIIVSGFFLIYNALTIRCGFLKILNQRCSDSTFKIPMLVLNSAVNPLAYALFKRDIKKEFKRMMCTGTLKTT